MKFTLLLTLTLLTLLQKPTNSATLTRISCEVKPTKKLVIHKIGSVCWTTSVIDTEIGTTDDDNVTAIANVIYTVPDNIFTIEKEISTTVNISDTNTCTIQKNLDRIDQQNLPLDCKPFKRPPVKPGSQKTSVFILDTGCMRDHYDFKPGSVELGPSFINGKEISNNAWDDNGHGTHVCGTVASYTYGIAYGANVKCGKVLSFDGKGFVSTILLGLKWVFNYKTSDRKIVNLSLNGPRNPLFDDAVAELIKNGIDVIASAGNKFENSCNNTSPNVAAGPNSFNLIKVGSIDNNDNIAPFSSYGSCVDIGAPGINIVSLKPDLERVARKDCTIKKPITAKKRKARRDCKVYNNKRKLYLTDIKTGTSMSTPLVTGYFALGYNLSDLRKNAVFIRGRPVMCVSDCGLGSGSSGWSGDSWPGFL